MDIKIATTKKKLNEIYSFRFKIYITELEKHFLVNDKTIRILKDEIDSSALQLYSEVDGNIVATMRCNIKPLTEEIRLNFDIVNQPSSLNCKYARLDRFMIHKDYRGSNLSISYMDWLYRYGLKNNVVVALIMVEPKLVNFYKRYGFEVYAEATVNSKTKNKRILCSLNLKNRNKLMKSRSPFLSILDSSKGSI